jgi:hypothetical protein
LKQHIGAKEHIVEMAHLAAERSEVRPRWVDPAEMTHRLEIASALGSLRATLAAALQQVDDTMLYAETNSYKQALAIYAVAKALGRDDVTIQKAIAPFAEFLATGPRVHQERSHAEPPATK